MANPEQKHFFWLRRILSVFGIMITPDKKHAVHLSSVFFFWIIGFIILGFIGSIGMYTYSTKPGFCNSCHIMEPYYNAWKTSKHFGKAVCVDCHYPPADNLGELLWHKFQASAQVIKYITRTYSSKPFAEIEDASCLRSGCHSTRLLDGKVITKKGIVFDHRPHLTEVLRERKLRCVSCHSQIVVGNHLEVIYSTCFLCHFKGRGKNEALDPVAGCLGCHNLPSKPIQVGNMSYNHNDYVVKRGLACKNCHVDVVKGDGKVDPSRCIACHNQPEKLAYKNDMPFLHETHVIKHNVACLHCHEEIRHGIKDQASDVMPRLNEPPLPQTTPEGPMPTLAFECTFCHESKHTGQLEMYAGKVKNLDLPSIPSPMYIANVDCIGCHYQEKIGENDQEFRGHTVTASPEACIKCHGPEFGGILKETKQELIEILAMMKDNLDLVKTTLEKSTLSADDKKSLQELFAKADRLQHFISLSHGEHNIYLASVALRQENNFLSEISKTLAIKLNDLSSAPLISGSYCATMCHKQLSIKVPPETVTAFGKTMPHLTHTTLMGCTSCHNIGAHKSVPLRTNVKEEVCSTCHPE